MPERLTVAEARRILRVGPAVGAPELTRRYRRLARDRHPDAGGDPDAFHRLQAAYELLRAEDGGTARPEPVRRGATGVDVAGPPAPDVSALDWDVPTDRARMTRDRLAVRVAAAAPLAPVTARSRGPRSPLNPLVRLLSPDLSSSLQVVPGRVATVRLTVRQGRMRRRLLDASLPGAWSRVRENRLVTARLKLPTRPEPRRNAARVVGAALDLLGALEWPAGAWRLDPPGRQPG